MTKNNGFTFIELIVVVVILAILVSVGVSVQSKYVGESKKNIDKQNIEAIKSAIINAMANPDVSDELTHIDSNTVIIEIIIDSSSKGNVVENVSGVSTPKFLSELNEYLNDGLPAAQRDGKTSTISVRTLGEVGGKCDGTCKIEITTD